MDYLYEKNDKITDQLAEILQKYDFVAIDKQKTAIALFETWSLKMVQVSGRVGAVIEAFFNCRLCSSLAVDPTVIEPCNHIFCKQCLENQGV